LSDGEQGLGSAGAAACYLSTPAGVTEGDAGLRLSLGFKTEAPAFLVSQGRTFAAGARRSRLRCGAEEGRGEENLAAWRAWTALSGSMTPAA